ncbi:MAG: vanadium-dependent haloperoxidase [Acidimicrobiales bacterium]
MVGFLPASSATFDAALTDSLAAIPDGQAEMDGVAAGEAAGWGTLAYRLGDGSQSGAPFPLPEPGPGVGAPTPPATGGLTPWLKDARPYTMRSNDQFRPDGPPPLHSKRYERALDEVRRVGGTTSTERSAAQTEAALFWGDQPIAQAQRALRGKAAQLDSDIVATARLYAAVLTSQADAFIACWDAKYHYVFWRPWQSVPQIEPGWTPLLSTPNHPEYPSAHGCATGALACTLSELLGTDTINLAVDAANIGVTHHFATRDDLISEVGDARIRGGLHYRFSVDAGVIAERVVRLNLSRNFRLSGHHG